VRISIERTNGAQPLFLLKGLKRGLGLTCLIILSIGVDSVIHLASPLPGTSDARKAIDVRTLLPPPSSARRTLISASIDYFQAAKGGCLNIVRQAEKAGIKQIVVISSVAALALLIPGITVKAPLTSNGTPCYAFGQISASISDL